MMKNKRFGRVCLCLMLVAACLVLGNPVSALSTFNVTNDTTLPVISDAVSERPAGAGHLVSYVHYSANRASTVIGCLEEGTRVTVLGTNGSYYKIDCYDMTGYISQSQVAVDETGAYYVCPARDNVDTTTLPSYTAQQTLELKSQIGQVAKKYIGVSYVFGGTSPRGFDCSGYTQYVFRQVGISLNRTAAAQLSNGVIVAKEDLQPGDLVIFSNTGDGGFASHIGMYLGNGLLIHSGSSKGVCIVELDSTYFATHYQCARRVILSDASAAATMPSVGSITGSMGSGWRNEG